jgi:poly-gamma-glutamate capsule biosynthesis protein CapA/YwtB (metallophosphatase superfamily)
MTWNHKNNKSSKFILTFAGDTSLGDYYFRKPVYEEQRMRLEKDPMSFFTGVISLLKDTSYLIVNLETVLADNPVSPLEGRKKYLGWDNPERTLKVLKQIGVDAVSLANNHTMDFGPEILLESRKQLIDVGIQPFGAGESIGKASKPIKIECTGKYNNKNIYIFGVMRVKWKKRFREDFNYHATKLSPGVYILEKKNLVKKITKIRVEEPDALIIVFAHWQGFDYEWANEKKINLCNKLIDCGADLIIGHGSHMMQQIYTYNSGVAICSIGNFVFNSKGGYKIKNAPPYSFVVRLELEEQRNSWEINTKIYPIFSNNLMQDYRPRPVTENEIQEIISTLDEHALDAMQTSNGLRYNQNELGFYLFAGKDKIKEEKND